MANSLAFRKTNFSQENVFNLNNPESFPGVNRVASTILDSIGSTVLSLTFIEYKLTDKQTSKVYIYQAFKGISRPSSFSTFNCNSICEHLLFVQYKTITKTVRGFDNFFAWNFKIYKNLFFFVILNIHKPSLLIHRKHKEYDISPHLPPSPCLMRYFFSHFEILKTLRGLNDR